MTDAAHTFALQVYRELDDLFEPDMEVRIEHRTTNTTIDVSEFPSQTKNAVIAKIRLLKELRGER